jgi:DNA recombination protein RmuC
MTDILFLLLGLVIGAVSIWFLIKSKYSSAIEIQNNQVADLKKDLLDARNNAEVKESEITKLNASQAELRVMNKNLEEKQELQKKELEELYDKFNIQFKNLANEILEEKSKKFTEQNKEKIGELLNPLKEKLSSFEKKVEETYDKESKLRFSLKEEVKRLAELNVQVSKDANNLTKALKGESKTQGNWGEIILESILEKSGLVKDREYFVQQSYNNEEGSRLQPDVIVKYPGDRNVIIDSKVSLTAYERFTSAENDELQEQALKEHVISLKNHIQGLASKNYQDIYELNSLDFVMMFLPIEPAYFAAVQADQSLWNYAYEKRVLLISPTNLIASLKMIVSLWRQEYQNQNAEEIAKRAADLYDKFVALVQDLIEVGKKMKMSQQSYEAAMNKLSEGRGNIVKKIEDMKALGLKTKKDLPGSLVDRALNEE